MSNHTKPTTESTRCCEMNAHTPPRIFGIRADECKSAVLFARTDAATSQRAEKGQLCLTNIPRFEGPEISSPFLPRWDLPRMSRRQGNLQNFIYPPDHPSSMLLFRDSLLFPSYPESSVLFEIHTRALRGSSAPLKDCCF